MRCWPLAAACSGGTVRGLNCRVGELNGGTNKIWMVAHQSARRKPSILPSMTRGGRPETRNWVAASPWTVEGVPCYFSDSCLDEKLLPTRLPSSGCPPGFYTNCNLHSGGNFDTVLSKRSLSPLCRTVKSSWLPWRAAAALGNVVYVGVEACTLYSYKPPLCISLEPSRSSWLWLLLKRSYEMRPRQRLVHE